MELRMVLCWGYIRKRNNMMTKHNFRETSRCSNFNENNNNINLKMQISKEQHNKRDLEENHKVFPLFFLLSLSSTSFMFLFYCLEIEEIHGIHEYRIGKIGIGLKVIKKSKFVVVGRRWRRGQLLPVCIYCHCEKIFYM